MRLENKVQNISQSVKVRQHLIAGFPANLEIREYLENVFPYFQAGKVRELGKKNASNQGKVSEFFDLNKEVIYRLLHFVSCPNKPEETVN